MCGTYLESLTPEEYVGNQSDTFILSSRVSKIKKTQKVDMCSLAVLHEYSVFQTHTYWKLQGPLALNYVNQQVQKGPKLLAFVLRIPKRYNT